MTSFLSSFPPITISHDFFVGDVQILQRRSCKLSFRSRPAARVPRRACSQVNQPSPLDSTGALLQILSIREKENIKFNALQKYKTFQNWISIQHDKCTFAKLNRKHYSPVSLWLSVLKSVLKNVEQYYLTIAKGFEDALCLRDVIIESYWNNNVIMPLVKLCDVNW